jgi:carboxymethylenebutenolidase
MTDFKRYLLDEFVEDYEHGLLARRDALKLIAGITGSLALASSILAACTPPEQPATPAAPVSTSVPTTAPTIPPTTRPTAAAVEPAATTAPEPTATASGDIAANDVQFQGEGATLLGYLARPAGGDKVPVVLVCHENRGLTDHIKDVTRRFARVGYVALAVDLLSRQGGTAANAATSVPGLLSNMPQDQFVADFTSGWHYLQSQSYVQADRVGMVGFCFGGGVTWRVAIGLPELRAAVPFYGPPPSSGEVVKINAAVLAIYGELDQRITSSAATMEAAMKQNNKVFDRVIYPNANHAFFNDTGPNYNADAARAAWARTVAWFDQYLKSA